MDRRNRMKHQRRFKQRQPLNNHIIGSRRHQAQRTDNPRATLWASVIILLFVGFAVVAGIYGIADYFNLNNIQLDIIKLIFIIIFIIFVNHFFHAFHEKIKKFF